MLWVPLIALTVGGGPSAPAASRDADLALARAYVASYGSSRAVAAHLAIPAWARKYNVNCSTCHSPVVPRLNETGEKFKWAGYRMPEEIGEKVDVAKVQNYLAAGLNASYEWEKTEGEATTTNGFTLPSIALFYAGPLGRNFGSFIELDHGPDNEVERVAQVSVLWGNQKHFGGLRFGQMHYLAEWGLAGFDRSVGINAPLAIDGPVTEGVPFAFGELQLGLEAYYVTGRNRLSAQILNGVNTEGAGAVADADQSKDFLVTDQLMFDHYGSGIQGVAYYGTIRGLDASGTNVNLDTHYWRLGVTADKYFHTFELLGAVVYAEDKDLPVGGAFTDATNKGLGWWFSAQYSFLKDKETAVTLLGRYEEVNPNTAATDAANRRVAVGMVVPMNLPQYLRWSLEYHMDFPQGGGPKTNNVAMEFRLLF